MSTHPFAGFNPRPSPWGYNWTADDVGVLPKEPQRTMNQAANHCSSSPEPHLMADQYANMPAALLSTLKREKKPFTYTPGGVNLSEVLNARLQKRMERKKKYSEERAREDGGGFPNFDSPKQVVVMPTYNSPLDMYSMENALEALEVQAELVSADKSLSATSRSATLPRNHTFRFEDKDLDPGRGVAQSKAFRVLQIITDTEEESTERPHLQHRDEMRFTGIRESKAIPSKFFHTLQKITGTDEDDDQQKPQQIGVARPAQCEKSTAPVSRPQFLPPPQQQQQQVDGVHQQQSFGATALKRPAAFLPIKITPGSGFRPVQPPSVPNGPLRRIGNAAAGTDF